MRRGAFATHDSPCPFHALEHAACSVAKSRVIKPTRRHMHCDIVSMHLAVGFSCFTCAPLRLRQQPLPSVLRCRHAGVAARLCFHVFEQFHLVPLVSCQHPADTGTICSHISRCQHVNLRDSANCPVDASCAIRIRRLMSCERIHGLNTCVGNCCSCSATLIPKPISITRTQLLQLHAAN